MLKSKQKLRNLYQKEIKNIIRQIVKKYKPQGIILFGSCINMKRINKNSDIDMLIVKNVKKRRIDRIKDVLQMTDYNLPFEPLVYTPNEVSKNLSQGDLFLRSLLKEGIVIYEK